MARTCQVTGRKPKSGHSYSIRGIAKKKKGIGLNITGKVKRRFTPNIRKKRVWVPEEKRFITIRLSAAGLRTLEKVGVAKTRKRMKQTRLERIAAHGS